VIDPITVLQILGVLNGIQNSSIQTDIQNAIKHPSPPTIMRIACDGIQIAAPFEPHAKLAGVGCAVATIMLQHPSHISMEGQMIRRHHGRQ
jgi:hypothetical protein